ncbi:hypothetical protein BH20VER3_BH20VER3_00590 [soil metagenome]
MKWEEIIAESREAGYLRFCADGIAVLQQVPTDAGTVAPPTAEERGLKPDLGENKAGRS